MSRELTTNGVYCAIRDIFNNSEHSINADCFKRADIIRLLCDLRYIDAELYSQYDIDRTVSAALKKARYTRLICIVLLDDCRWHNEYCFVSASAAALEGKTAKKEDKMTSHYYALGIMKREAQALYDNISQLHADFANIKTLKQYSTKELLDEIQRRVEAKNSL
mgnify:CR=1 FL=1